MKKFSAFLAFLLLAVILFALLAPWKEWLEMEMKRRLAAQGLTDAAFSVEAVDLHGIVLKDVSLGGKWPVKLDRLTVDYSIEQLLNQQIQNISADSLTLRYDETTVHIEDTQVAFTPAQGEWKGDWKTGGVMLEEAPIELPPLAGNGSFSVTREGAVNADGTLASEDGSHRVEFTLEPEALKVHSATLPWNGATLSTRSATFPLKGGSSKVNVQVKDLPLDMLLSALTSERARATGTLSGSVPVTIVIGETGDFVVHNGVLKADGPGTISVGGELFSSNNEQLAMLSQVLSDFRYHKLSVTLSSGADKKLSAHLAIEGNNPAFQNGREIKLNVNLTGDVLSLFQQSVMPITDPEKFLKQEKQ